MALPECLDCTYYHPLSSIQSYDLTARMRSSQPVGSLEAAQLFDLAEKARKDLDGYDNKLAELIKRVAALEDERNAMEQQLQSVDSLLSPIRTLPVEMIREIFSHHCEDNFMRYLCMDNRYIEPLMQGHGGVEISVPALELSFVCSAWHDVVKSMPSLFTSFAIEIGSAQPSQHLSRHMIAALTRILELSKSRPLIVSFDSYMSKENFGEIVAPLLLTSSRWVEADIVCRDAKTLCPEGPFATLRNRVPLLERIGLGFIKPNSELPVDMFFNAPSLRSIVFRSLTPGYATSFPWSQIRSLVAEPIPHYEACLLLALAPNVESMTMVNDLGGAEKYRGAHIPYVSSSTVTELDIIHNEDDEVELTLSALTLPRLTDLDILFPTTEKASTPIHCPSLHNFFSSFAQTLTYLAIGNAPTKENDLAVVLGMLINLDTLGIECAQEYTSSFTRKVAQSLIRDRNCSSQRNLLSKLTRLGIDIHHSRQDDNDPTTVDFQLLADIAKSRSTAVVVDTNVLHHSKLHRVEFQIRDRACSIELAPVWRSLRLAGMGVMVEDLSGYFDPDAES